ncbi:hypothetical protein HDV00_010849 [Rhizophlyctis rosea]|nr:hypothetical protein HDV00_010849 [Rhizophlyctis rosea]
MSYEGAGYSGKLNMSGKNSGRTILPMSGPVETSVFTLCYAITQNRPINNILNICLIILTDIQFLAYAFEPQLGFGSLPWWMPYFFNPLRYEPTDGDAFKSLFYVAISLFFLTIVLEGMAMISLHGIQLNTSWPLRILRSLMKLFHTILLLPLLEIYLRAFLIYDYDDPGNTSYLWTDQTDFKQILHLPVLAAFGLVWLAIQMPLVSLVSHRMTPIARNSASQTTGRIDFTHTLFRILLAISHQVVRLNPSFQISCVTISAAILSYLVIRHQPSYNARINDVRAGIFTATMITGIQAGIGKVRGYDDARGFVVMLSMLMVGFAIGFGASVLVRDRVTKGVYKRLKEHQAIPASQSATKLRSSTSGQPRIKNSRAMDIEAARFGESRSGMVLSADDDEIDIFADIDKIVEEKIPEPTPIFLTVSDVELACRFLQNIYNPSKQTLTLANAILYAGVEQYPNSAWLSLMKAHYIKTYGIREKESVAEYVHYARVSKPSFDMRFFIFVEERAQEREDRKDELEISMWDIKRHGGLLMLENNARKWHLESLIVLKSMWEYLKSDSANADCLPYILDKLTTNRQKANKCYQQLLKKYPNSKQVLRKYSSFLLTVTNDSEQAKRLLDRAEDIENAEAREYTMHNANMRLRTEETFRPSTTHPQIPTEGDNRPMEVIPSDAELETDLSRESTTEPINMDALQKKRPSVLFTAQPEGAPPQLSAPNQIATPRRSSLVPRSPNLPPAFDFVGNDGQPHLMHHESYVTDEEQGTHGRGVNIRRISLLERQRARDDGKEEKGIWPKGPGSLPSDPSATSSQKDARQYKYFKNILEGRLTVGIDQSLTMVKRS